MLVLFVCLIDQIVWTDLNICPWKQVSQSLFNLLGIVKIDTTLQTELFFMVKAITDYLKRKGFCN